MSALSKRLLASSIDEFNQAGREIEALEVQVGLGREASLAMHCLTQAALTRGYDKICDAIDAAPVKSSGYRDW